MFELYNFIMLWLGIFIGILPILTTYLVYFFLKNSLKFNFDIIAFVIGSIVYYLIYFNFWGLYWLTDPC